MKRRTTDLTEANEKLLDNNVDPVTSLESQLVVFEESQVDVPEAEKYFFLCALCCVLIDGACFFLVIIFLFSVCLV